MGIYSIKRLVVRVEIQGQFCAEGKRGDTSVRVCDYQPGISLVRLSLHVFDVCLCVAVTMCVCVTMNELRSPVFNTSQMMLVCAFVV